MSTAAVLLAAGKGTRLWPLTEVRAKAAVPFRGVPVIRSLADQLAKAGITQLAVNLHHLPETVRASLAGMNVTYSYEDCLLGTSGALHPLRDSLRDSWFWTVNAKIVIDLPPLDPTSHSAVLTAVLVSAPLGAPYTRVEVTGEPPRIRGFSPSTTHDGSGLVYTGIQLVSPRIWEFLPEPGFSHFTTDVYPRLWAGGETVAACVVTTPWLEFSTLSRYLTHHLRLGARREWWGRGADVASTARVSDSVVWDGVAVEHGARVHRCILADGVRIRAGRSLEAAAVVPLECSGPDSRGEILDDNLVVAIPS
ncbi:NDP-sugar synthase [Candidatus Fermentibacteria bacterium]|nr:NDP-sugar synthase [Candidatus Fermentibacteria bacterium]